MYQSVQKVLDNFQSSWTVLPAFQGLRDEFLEKFELLKELDYDQRFVAKNSGSIKRDHRRKLAKKAKLVQNALLAYAAGTKNLELTHMIKFAPSRLQYGSSIEVRAMVDLVISKAEEHLSGLEDYGVTQTVLTDLIATRDEVDTEATSPRDKIVSRKAITRTIKITINRLDELLRDQMDRLVATLEPSEPQFHMRYFDARIVVDLPGSRSGSKGSDPSPNQNPHGV